MATLRPDMLKYRCINSNGNKHVLFLGVLFLLCTSNFNSQTIRRTPLVPESIGIRGEDSLVDLVRKSPHFTLFKDNYFITGSQVGEKITNTSSDAKFQISFRHRLTDAILPLKTFVYLTYTQKSFWDIYKKSAPFRENNYNPSIGLGKWLTINNKLIGLQCAFDHESNGREGLESRSWNRIIISSEMEMNTSLIVFVHIWAPVLSLEDNRDILHYYGNAEVSVQWSSVNERFVLDITGRKGNGLNWHGFILSQASYKLRNNGNQFIGAQLFTGYGENLIDYKERKIMFRIGFYIRPVYHKKRFVF